MINFRSLHLAASILLVLAVGCSISPPPLKVEVASASGGRVAFEEFEGSEDDLSMAETATGPSGAGRGGSTSGFTPARQISATSAEALVAAARDCKPQPGNEPGVTLNSIKLGSTFARSGPVANISGPIEQGVRAYFRAINEAGGICGRKIDLVGYDDGWSPQEGRRLIQKLVEDDKVFFLAVVPSSLGLQAATQYLEEKGVPAVGTSGLLESQFTKPLIWAAGASTGVSSPHVALPFLVKERGISKFAGFYLSDLEVGRMAAATIDEEIERNGATLCAPLVAKRIADTEYSSGWASILNQSQSKCQGPPEYVFFGLDPSGIIKAVKQATWRPTKGWGTGPPGFLDIIPQQIGPGLSSGDTIYQAQSPYYPPIDPFMSLPGVQAYVRTVQKYYGTTVDLKNPFLEGGYCGAAMAAEAIRLAGPDPTRAKIIEALDSLTDWSCGVSLPMTFRKGNHFGNRSFIGVKLVFQGNSWTWVPETCTTPTAACWRTDPRAGQLPAQEPYRNRYQA